jgi:hypothetical protein
MQPEVSSDSERGSADCQDGVSASPSLSPLDISSSSSAPISISNGENYGSMKNEGRRSIDRDSMGSQMSVLDENIDENFIAYPPLGMNSSGALRRMAKKDKALPFSSETLHHIEWWCSFIGGICFIWGSYLFLPTLPESTKPPAAIMFIGGSILFMIASL